MLKEATGDVDFFDRPADPKKIRAMFSGDTKIVPHKPLPKNPLHEKIWRATVDTVSAE